MRLGELKKIMDSALSEEKHLIYNAEQRYGGHRYYIEEFANLYQALNLVALQAWVKSDNSILTILEKKYPVEEDGIEIDPDEHNLLTSLINEINQQLPLFYGILESVVEEQEENIINIKIPIDAIEDFDKLNKFNKELQEIFKLIVKHKGLGGDIKFMGFDIGTSWYKVLIGDSKIIYFVFMTILSIAYSCLKIRTEYYKSEEARVAAQILKDSRKEEKIGVTEKEIKDYVEKYIKKKLDEEIQKLIEDDKFPKQNLGEQSNSLRSGTLKMMTLMERGAEFHPSLNAPKFIENKDGEFYIDHEKLTKVLEEEKNRTEKVKQIESKADNEEEANEEDD